MPQKSSMYIRIEETRKAIAESSSFAEVLRKLGMQPAGGNTKTLKKVVRDLQIDTTHFTGKSYWKGKALPFSNKRPLCNVLVFGKEESSRDLKHRLISEGVKEHRCEGCNQIEWMGQPIPIELHHIDGIRKNNKLENLKILCPNCHAQTPGFSGRTPQYPTKLARKCGSCQKQICSRNKSGFCQSCRQRNAA